MTQLSQQCRLILVIALAAMVVPLSTWGQRQSRPTIAGKVVGVTDGDTITLLDSEKRTHKIRLEGIDAPETGQAFGTQAKKVLSDKVFGKEVTIEDMGPDKYGRTLGHVYVEHRHVNLELVT